MALSTNIPAPSASPPSVMILRVSPAKYINTKVAMMETGIAKLTMKVGPILLRKRKRTNTASRMPKIRLSLTSPMADEM